MRRRRSCAAIRGSATEKRELQAWCSPVSAKPVVGLHLSHEAPAGWPRRLLPVQWLAERLRPRGGGDGGAEIPPLRGAERVGCGGDEAHRPAPGQEIEPLPACLPRDRIR